MYKTRKCDELLQQFNNKNAKNNSSKINIQLNENKDIYNITAEFNFNNQKIIAGRVEARDSEHSQVVFFKKEKDIYIEEKKYPRLNLQDPFFTFIDDEIILGGVEIYDDPLNVGQLAYRTIFLKGKSLDKLEKFAQGPERMKDIRLLKLNNNKILVFTRPQGEIGGRGTIGFIIIDRLEDLTVENIKKATLLDEQFILEEWGGANELHLLKNNKVGVLAHIAKFDEEGNRHYYSATFCFDPETFDYTPMKLIAIRNNFEDGAFKRADLIDVIFSGGIVRLENGKANLYCGVSDAEAHMITIDDPFLEYENN